MSKRRFNIWLDNELIETVTIAAKAIGVKASTYMRMAILEKLNRKPRDGWRDQDPDMHQVRTDQGD